MSTTAPTPRSAAPPTSRSPRVRAAVVYALDGDLRFLAHHDEMRMLTRALVRADWPLRYSAGFNPQPRIVIPLPRNLGQACDEQLALIDLHEEPSATALAGALGATLPAGARLRDVHVPLHGETPQATAVTYELPLEPDERIDPESVRAVLAGPTLMIEREFGPDKPTTRVDVRPYLDAIVIGDARVRLVVRVDRQRTARPTEILALLGLPAACCVARIRRVAVRWDRNLTGPPDGSPNPGRNQLGQEDNEALLAQADG